MSRWRIQPQGSVLLKSGSGYLGTRDYLDKPYHRPESVGASYHGRLVLCELHEGSGFLEQDVAFIARSGKHVERSVEETWHEHQPTEPEEIVQGAGKVIHDERRACRRTQVCARGRKRVQIGRGRGPETQSGAKSKARKRRGARKGKTAAPCSETRVTEGQYQRLGRPRPHKRRFKH